MPALFDVSFETVALLAGRTAHRLRNLLLVVSGSAELAGKSLWAGHPALEFLARIRAAAEELSGLATTLAVAGWQEDGPTVPFDLTSTLGEAVALMRLLVPTASHLVSEVPNDQAVWVLADQIQLQQALLWLAVGVGHTAGSGARFAVRLQGRPQTSAGSDAESEAPGLAGGLIIVEHDRPNVEAAGDAALGPLPGEPGRSMLARLAAKCAGRLRVEPWGRSGLRIELWLPACPPPRPAADGEVPANRETGQGPLVLLLDGDKAVRSILVSALTSAGYRVVAAGSWPAGIEKLSAHGAGVQLIVLDMDSLPDIEPSWLGDIRRTGSAAPVILIKGSQILDPGVYLNDDVLLLPRPFRTSALVALAADAIAMASATEEA